MVYLAQIFTVGFQRKVIYPRPDNDPENSLPTTDSRNARVWEELSQIDHQELLATPEAGHDFKCKQRRT